MTEVKAIALMIEHLESLFPKSCPNCQCRFETLRDYMLMTKPKGLTIAYDLELDELEPPQPIGTVAMANCACGSTLALTSEGMPLLRLWSLLLWAKGETRRRGMTAEEFMQYVRGAIRHRVLSQKAIPPESPAA